MESRSQSQECTTRRMLSEEVKIDLAVADGARPRLLSTWTVETGYAAQGVELCAVDDASCGAEEEGSLMPAQAPAPAPALGSAPAPASTPADAPSENLSSGAVQCAANIMVVVAVLSAGSATLFGAL